ncbi:MAG: hypothetical protein Q7T55_06515 [Solirubrobacteraceae bacterium]|nr:hypothetical protein [Solirubrobacteraceae bacterium]
MPGNEATETARRSVSALGSRVGLSAQEFNVALKRAGLLAGEPNAWQLTEAGAPFAAVRDHTNGYGGSAYQAWDTTAWLETVIEKLDLSEEGVGQIRQVLADRRLAQKVARDAGAAAADEAFRQFQSAKRAAEAAGSAPRAPVVAVGLGAAVTAYGIYKAVPVVRRRWQQRDDAPPAHEGEGPTTT